MEYEIEEMKNSDIYIASAVEPGNNPDDELPEKYHFICPCGALFTDPADLNSHMFGKIEGFRDRWRRQEKISERESTIYRCEKPNLNKKMFEIR